MIDDKISAVRGLGLMAGVFEKQQSDPLCGGCKSFLKSHESVMEDLPEFARFQGELPEQYQQLLSDARAILEAVSLPKEPAPQRKLGTCTFPEKVCYIKHVRKVYLTTIGKEPPQREVK